ncbi:helix-turn-helix domain-containing protein [Hyphococcus lacteus]|uniref:Helix-turn-helix domain-containing protein n=1 Tax=Hyphococcus lacteus TaxID=3143536 RepID=A0ABV3Z2Z1_9PROT
MKSLEISEVVKRSGLPASTLRYYESLGLIESSGRRGLKRLFNPSVLERLDIISLSRWAGFTLDEIGDWFGRDGRVAIDKAQLVQKADEVEARATQMRALSKIIRHTSQCPEENHLECDNFRKLMKIARRHRPTKEATTKVR